MRLKNFNAVKNVNDIDILKSIAIAGVISDLYIRSVIYLILWCKTL
jgi:hypothetical protein